MSILVLIFVAVVAVPLQSSATDDCDGVCMQDPLKENCNAQEEKVVVCYFTNYAANREGKVSFKPVDVDGSLCTHVIYAFSMIDSSSSIYCSSSGPYDLKRDLPVGYFKDVIDLKKKGIKVIIYFGGWDNPNNEMLTGILDSAPSRKDFAAAIVKFLEKHDFDGLDIGYSYPGCPKGNMEAAKPNAKANFNQLLTELKTAFKGKYLLTVPTPAVKDYIDKCYDMSELCEIVDWLNLYSYKYQTYEDGKTGAQSPLCGADWDVTDTIKHYLDVVKCPPKKLVLGFAFYTQTYTMVNPSPAEFGVPVSGPGAPGPFLKAADFLTYYETCTMIKNGYEHGYNKEKGSYAWKDKQFLSYEGIVDVSRKACLISEFNLRGANMWTMDFDDFKDICGCGKYPLLKTMNQHLRCQKTPPVKCY